MDLLALDGEVVAVVEVKTTGATSGPCPTTRFLPPQARRLLAAARWMRRLRALEGRRVRHDLVAVSFDGGRSVVTIRRDVPVRRFARPFR